METSPKARALEKLVPRLKEQALQTDAFIDKEAIEPIVKKVEKVISDLNGVIKKKGTTLSVIQNELENVREQMRYYVGASYRLRKESKTYVYALETLYNEYDGSKKVKLSTDSHKTPNRKKEQLISDEMYAKIYDKLKEDHVTFNVGVASVIGVSKPTMHRFIKLGLGREHIRKLGNGLYQFKTKSK